MMTFLIMLFAFMFGWFLLSQLILKVSELDFAGWMGRMLLSRFPSLTLRWKFVDGKEIERMLGISALMVSFGVVLTPFSPISAFLIFIFSFIPPIYLNMISRKEIEEFKSEFALFVELLAVSLRGGVDILSSIETAHEVLTGRVRREVEALLLDVRNKNFYEALKDFAERNEIDEVKIFYEKVLHSKRTGSPLSSALIDIADDVRRRMIEDAEKRVNTLPQKIILPMLLLFIATLIYLTGPVIVGARKEVMF